MAGRGTSQRIAFLVWRDTAHPEGGGSELYVERVAAGLARHGHDVTIVCAAHENAPPDEVRDGVRFRRRGGRLTVYPWALLHLLGRRGRRYDIVVDVQNGLPFWSPLVRRRPVVVLVHHIHREQWHVIYPGIRGRIGWWLESTCAPRLYRRRRYVTVSESSARDLVGTGVDPATISIVRNGLDHHELRTADGSAGPRLCCVARLVPHKQLEDAIEVVARLRGDGISVQLDIVGDGWWGERLRECAAQRGVGDAVTFHGHVDDARRDQLLAGADLLLVPSLKEGWGLAIIEAAAQAVPAIGYAPAGGVAEAIVDNVTGRLVDDLDGMCRATRELLADPIERRRLGEAALHRARTFSWADSSEQFEKLLNAELPVELWP